MTTTFSSWSVEDRRQHIMQVTFGMVIGGLERVIMELCRRVDPSRYRLSICCIGRRGPLADVMEAEGVPVIVCEKQSKLAKYFRGVELARIFREHHVDLVHAHHTPALVDGVVGASLAGVPLITTDHTKAYPTSRRWRLLENGASRVAKVMVAVSAHSKADLIRYQGIAPEKLKVIHNGLDLKLSRRETVSELRREIGLAPEDLVIGTAARLEDQKGLDLLVDAVPTIARHVPNARVVIVGGGGREGALREQVERMRLGDRVLITGYRVDGVDLIDTFDCFVQTSHWEGMPMALLEAMALHKPIVATAVGGVPEVVVDGVTGILLSPRDRDALARSLIRVLTNRREAVRMGEAGYRRYLTHFTSAGMITEYEQLYASVLAGTRQGTLSEPLADRANRSMQNGAAMAAVLDRR